MQFPPFNEMGSTKTGIQGQAAAWIPMTAICCFIFSYYSRNKTETSEDGGCRLVLPVFTFSLGFSCLSVTSSGQNLRRPGFSLKYSYLKICPLCLSVTGNFDVVLAFSQCDITVASLTRWIVPWVAAREKVSWMVAFVTLTEHPRSSPTWNTSYCIKVISNSGCRSFQH